MRIPEHGFLLLETLRAYGAEQLAASGGEGDARRRHARHFVDWATEADRRLMDPGHGSIGDIDARVPELQSALDRKSVGEGKSVSASVDSGCRRLIKKKKTTHKRHAIHNNI